MHKNDPEITICDVNMKFDRDRDKDKTSGRDRGRTDQSDYVPDMHCVPKSVRSSFECIPPPDDKLQFDKHKNLLSSDSVPHSRQFSSVRPISEEEVRQALLKEVKLHSCWRSAAVNKLTIDNIRSFHCHHYTLETFTESRSVSKATEPYTVGQFMETVGAKLAYEDESFLSDIWALPCEPKADFAEEQRVFEVPGTTEMMTCQSCHADGVSHCFHCKGGGSDQCSYCRGTGMKSGIPHPAMYTHPGMGTQAHMPGAPMHIMQKSGGAGSYGKGTPMHYMSVSGIPPPGIGTHDLCFFCHGRGVKECSQCRGQGKKSCGACGGSGSMRSYMKLKIKFVVERSDSFQQEGGVPEQLIKQATGEVVLAEQNKHVLPIRNHELEEVNENSKRLCSIHLQKCLGTSRMIQQRHTLEEVPLAEVSYRLSGKSGTFWVYGNERLCHVPSYPSKCNIL